MINRIPCKCLLISSLSGLTRKRGMARASLAIPTRFLVAPDKLDIKRHKLGILYIIRLDLVDILSRKMAMVAILPQGVAVT